MRWMEIDKTGITDRGACACPMADGKGLTNHTTVPEFECLDYKTVRAHKEDGSSYQVMIEVQHAEPIDDFAGGQRKLRHL